jgi:hypothetical protein
METSRKTNRQRGRQTIRRTNRQRSRQTCRKTDSQYKVDEYAIKEKDRQTYQ